MVSQPDASSSTPTVITVIFRCRRLMNIAAGRSGRRAALRPFSFADVRPRHATLTHEITRHASPFNYLPLLPAEAPQRWRENRVAMPLVDSPGQPR